MSGEQRQAWQCFTEYREAMHHEHVFAETADEAAVAAAHQTGIDGIWIVVPSAAAIEVKITRVSIYKPVGNGGSHDQ